MKGRYGYYIRVLGLIELKIKCGSGRKWLYYLKYYFLFWTYLRRYLRERFIRPRKKIVCFLSGLKKNKRVGR